ncbi:MAG TPA: pentapeptide repeat-containing protein [Cyclobacteriaceae bacterium]|nr:pentapeptide repeat-containing protein [Cyclobacteriaceae bacterium]
MSSTKQWVISAFRTLQEMEGQPAARWRIPFLHLIDEPEEAAVVFVLLGIGIAVGGYVFLYGLGTLRDIVGDFYANIAAEAISIAITVLIIERLYERRSKTEAEKTEKERLILQMGSPDNGFAVEAVRQLRQRGWLSDGSLEGVDLTGANLRKAMLSGAVLTWADLTAVDLVDADLSDADLYETHLRGTRLHKANLMSANLSGAILWNTYLEEADLTGADMRAAKFFEAFIDKVNLTFADLRGAVLCDIDLTQVNLRDVNLKGTGYVNDTIWPEGFDPKAAGAIEVKWNEALQQWTPVD